MDASNVEKVEKKVVRCDPPKAKCPHCGKLAKRVKRLTRTVTSMAYKRRREIEIYYGEYETSCRCCATFRTNPDDIVPPKSQYDNLIRDAVLKHLIEDRLNVASLIRLFERDFLIKLSPGFIYDCLRETCARLDLAEYRRLTRERFSGVLCVDELHLGHFTLLLATDPVSDIPIAFALVSANDKNHMRGFLTNLKTWGFWPRIVISDRSLLYPDLIHTLWPLAEHQLCLFHVWADINKAILDAIRRLRRQMTRSGNRGRKKRRGRQSNKQRRAQERRGPTLKQRSAFIFKHRYLITKRPENMSPEELAILETMYHYLPELKTLRAFAESIMNLFEQEITLHAACCRYSKLRNHADFQAIPELAKVFDWFDDITFRKTVAYLTHPESLRTKIRTNNHVERTNRTLRFAESVRYKWRRRRSLVRFIVLNLHSWWQNVFHADNPSGTSSNRARGSAKSKTMAS